MPTLMDKITNIDLIGFVSVGSLSPKTFWANSNLVYCKKNSTTNITMIIVFNIFSKRANLIISKKEIKRWLSGDMTSVPIPKPCRNQTLRLTTLPCFITSPTLNPTLKRKCLKVSKIHHWIPWAAHRGNQLPKLRTNRCTFGVRVQTGDWREPSTVHHDSPSAIVQACIVMVPKTVLDFVPYHRDLLDSASKIEVVDLNQAILNGSWSK